LTKGIKDIEHPRNRNTPKIKLEQGGIKNI
jgi:hypothetical protein